MSHNPISKLGTISAPYLHAADPEKAGPWEPLGTHPASPAGTAEGTAPREKATMLIHCCLARGHKASTSQTEQVANSQLQEEPQQAGTSLSIQWRSGREEGRECHKECKESWKSQKEF